MHFLNAILLATLPSLSIVDRHDISIDGKVASRTSIFSKKFPMDSEMNIYNIYGYFGSASITTSGFASYSTSRLNVGIMSNSPSDAGNARSAERGSPFLFPLLRWTRFRQKNSNPAAVCDPVLPYRALTPRLAGHFTSALPIVCVLGRHSATLGLRCTLTPNEGGQGPLWRFSTAARPHSQRLPWGESLAFSSLWSELRVLWSAFDSLGANSLSEFFRARSRFKTAPAFLSLGIEKSFGNLGGCHAP
jgi:hypothetical protein